MNIFLRESKNIFKKIIYNDKKKSILQKWKQSLLAIFFALTLTSLLILIKGENPFVVFISIFEGATRNKASMDDMLIYFTMFSLSGLAIIIGFKSGLFNIGVAGQMIISGLVMVIIGVKTSLPWPLIVIIGMLVAGIAASISGALKALFNIHEVVSTILINWVFFWISQYLLGPDMSWTNEYGTTKELAKGTRLMMNDSLVTPAMIIMIILLISAIVLFNFTKFGFALKAVGQNLSASKYAGIKVTFQLSFAMALSGFAVGALASINYLGKEGSMSYSTSQSLPAIGFQGISVALISFNSLFGLIPAALFWAIVTSGADYAAVIHPEIPKEILQLMNGFIIYAIAISIVFIRFRPLRAMHIIYLKLTSEEIKEERIKLKKAKQSLDNLYKENHKILFILNTTKLEEKIKGLKFKRLDLLKQVNIIEKIFNKENKKPISLFKWFIKDYKKVANKHEILLMQKRSKIDSKIEILYNKETELKTQIKEILIKENKAKMRDSLRIINEEYKKRILKINEKYREKNLFAKWREKYEVNKNLNKLYEEKHNILLLELKDILKIEKNKDKRNLLKQNFEKETQKFKSEIYKKVGK